MLVAARAGVRRARRDVSGRRRHRPLPVLLARPARRLHRRLGVVAAGGVHRADRGARRDHLRQQRRLGATSTSTCCTQTAQRRPAQRAAGSSSRPSADGRVHRDQPRRREVHVRQQRDRRDLEDRRAAARHRRRRRRCRSTRATSTAGGGFMPFGVPRRLRRADRRRRVRPAGLRAGGAAGRRGARPEEGPVPRDHRRDGDRRGALHPAAGRVHRRRRPGEHRHGWANPLGSEPVRLRRLVHARARRRRRLAGRDAHHRRGHLTGRHRHRLRRHHRPAVVRARRGARDAERAGHDEQSTACRWCRSSSRPSSACIAFGPFKSWNQLVSVVTGATAIMYAFAPVSLGGAAHARRRPAAPVPDAGAERSCCRPRSSRRT